MIFHVFVEGFNRYFTFSTLQFDLENKEIIIKKKELNNIVFDSFKRFDFSDKELQDLLNDVKKEIEKRKK
jgi:hypothetical protein